jgi:hypothetical protein
MTKSSKVIARAWDRKKRMAPAPDALEGVCMKPDMRNAM